MLDERVQLHHSLRQITVPVWITRARSRWLLGLVLLVTACASPQYRALKQDPGSLPLRASVADVPFYPQEELYCGPASLAMVLNWSGIPVTQAQVAEQVYTPGREGTLPSDILAGARRNSVLAVRVDSLHDLLAELAAGHPVLVFQNLGLQLIPQWHFAVAIGYNLADDVITLHSGTTPQRVTDLNTFVRTWERAEYWAVTVTPPSELPAEASQQRILEAASGLERAGDHEAAIIAYETIIERWHDSVNARIGLGNALYAAGRFESSARAFREATGLAPDNAPAWNNLAYALDRLDRRQEALEAARQAVTVSGGQEAYLETLQEIRSGRSRASSEKNR